MAKKGFFDVFLEEKKVPFKVFRLKDKNDNIYVIENDFIIQLIKSEPKEEQKKIEKVLKEIDFRNGDVNDYLEHLAQCYIDTTFNK